jgi:hypothetical protein
MPIKDQIKTREVELMYQALKQPVDRVKVRCFLCMLTGTNATDECTHH